MSKVYIKQELLEKKLTTKDPTLTAQDPYNNDYTEIFGEDEWFSMTPKQRQDIIDADMEREEQEAEEVMRGESAYLKQPLKPIEEFVKEALEAEDA